MAPQPVTVADYRAQFWAQQAAEERVEGEASPAVCVGGKRLPQEPRERLMRDGYGSIPIHTIFRGMNIHKSQLF